jgi:hypothetical protein
MKLHAFFARDHGGSALIPFDRRRNGINRSGQAHVSVLRQQNNAQIKRLTISPEAD